MKITPREKRRHAAGRENIAWGDFHARSRFARSTIPEEEWGTTRSPALRLRSVLKRGHYGSLCLATFEIISLRKFKASLGLFCLF